MTLQSDLETAVADVKADARKLKGIVNGPASGAGSTVATDSGEVKTAARAIAEVGDLSGHALKDLKNVPDADFAAKARAAGVDGIRVSGDDTSAGDLEGKLLASGLAGFSTQNPAGAETRTIDVPVASQAQAEAGADNATAMTPLRVAQAIVALSPGLPAGSVIASGRSVAPSGYLHCNGAAISRTAYADLFTAIGTTFGAGDGSKTFNIPDLRGEFLRGWDNGRGVDSERVFGSHQADAFKAHHHTQGRFGVRGAGGSQQYVFNASGSFFNTGATGGTETRPRNVALAFHIKY